MKRFHEEGGFQKIHQNLPIAQPLHGLSGHDGDGGHRLPAGGHQQLPQLLPSLDGGLQGLRQQHLLGEVRGDRFLSSSSLPSPSTGWTKSEEPSVTGRAGRTCSGVTSTRV